MLGPFLFYADMEKDEKFISSDSRDESKPRCNEGQTEMFGFFVFYS